MASTGLAGWASLPEVAVMLEVPFENRHSDPTRIAGAIRCVRRALMRSAGPNLTRVGSIAFLETSVQMRRVLAPIIEALVPDHGTAIPVYLPPLGLAAMRAAQRASSDVLGAYHDWFRANGVPIPPMLWEELLKVELIARRAQAASLGDQGIEALVVATQQNGCTRAVIAASHSSGGTTTYYLPHAPVAENARYADLPVDLALLRGTAEAAYYRRLGVQDGKRVHVVGDPAFSLPSPPPRTDVQHLVYAPSTYSDAILAADVAVIQSAVDRPVMVSLHARMRGAGAAKLFPPTWRILPSQPTTANLGDHGASALIQHGSGVGLEALVLGVEVIDLRAKGDPPTYPYLQSPHVQVVHDGPTLRDALARLPARRAEQESRREFARAWCAESGPNAAVAAANIIRSTKHEGHCENVLLDGWRTSPESG